jgi:putative oxidoreductase
MKTIKTFLFKEPRLPMAYSVMLLAVRIIFGALFMSHGIAKWVAFNEATENFPNPLGMGSTLSFWLAIFAEVACSFGFILGALFRLCLIPMIFTMCVALFVIHASDPLVIKELALMYLTIFVLTFFSGPGRFSIDEILRKAIS